MSTRKSLTVKIVDVPAAAKYGYRWQWRSRDGKSTSRRAFDLFYQCVEDAHARGHDVELAGPRGKVILTAQPVSRPS